MKKGFYYDEYYDALVIYTGFRNIYQYDHQENYWFRWSESFFHDLNRLEFVSQ